METRFWPLLVAWILSSPAWVCAQPVTASYFVARNGNDAWSGRLPAPDPGGMDGPFATLERARDALRALRKQGGLPPGGGVVELRGGLYERDRLFELTAEDSGTADAPVVYRARRGEEVRLSGGKTIGGWKPVTDSTILERLDPAARGKVLQVDLRAHGIEDCGDFSGGFGLPSSLRLELFFNDQPMTLARYPKAGFIRIAGALGKTERDVRGRKSYLEGIFQYEGDRPGRWAGEKDAWLLGYWYIDWAEQRHRIASIDPEKRVVEVAKPFHSYGYRKGQWFRGFNLLTELSEPGEWCLDREAGTLFFWPPAPVETGRAYVTVLPDLVALREASHVCLSGIILEGCRGKAIGMAGGENNQVAGCTIRNLGGGAVKVAGGKGHRVTGCDIYATGDGGISLDGGDRKTLAPAGHCAENNHIHHYSRYNRTYRPAISLGGVGNRAAHNLIHNAPHMAMGFGGNDHVIELNEIHSVCYESNDCGAIYAGRNWTTRGHLLRHNYLHHISGHEGRGSVGIYLDDMFSSAALYGNVFYQVTRPAFIGGGRDNMVENNIFVDCPRAMHIDCRALGWAAPSADAWIREANEKGTISGIRYQEPPYSTRYPPLAGILADEPKAPKGNIVRRNLFWLGPGAEVRRAARGADPKETWWDSIAEQAKPLVTFEDNLINEDPKFVDENARNFQLRDDSPAWKLGFQRIPVEKMGLYPDAGRASWPVTHAVRPAPQLPAAEPR